MEIDALFDQLVEVVRVQSDHYEKTGEVLELELPDLEELTIDANDPPEVRRRVIMFRAKLQQWREEGRQRESERLQAAYVCLENITAMFENLM